MVMKTLTIAAAMLALGTEFAVCKQRDPEVVSKPQEAAAALSAKPNGVAWFQGDIDAAFDRAKAEGKPVFLYWSAEWCPPCHELKATLFTRPQFQEKLKLFVPVYLDGDTPGAQSLGEAFNVVAYPTMFLLKSDRTELARITGGMNLAYYDEMLDRALGDVKPLSQLFASIDGKGVQLSRDDCRRLAFNGWGVDENLRGESARASATAIRRAVERCPEDAGVERARLTIAAAMASSNADSDALRAGKPASAMTMELVNEVYRVLGNAKLASGIADSLLLLGDEFLAAAATAQKETPDFSARLSKVANALSDDGRTPAMDPVYALVVEVRADASLASDHKVAPALAKKAREQLAAELAKKRSNDARASLVATAIGIYYMLGDIDAAFSLAEKEMRVSKQAYYFMSMLAGIEEQRGNKEKAVEWLGRAYRESKGPATRFEWGTNYVTGLVRMRPDDAPAIRDTALRVLGELDGPGRVYARATTRLKQLDASLRGWNKEGAHVAEIAVLRQRMTGICSKIPDTEKARKTCDAFLAET